ncbi:ABC transporter permease [Krasilnikoviella flava]|uniref:ABC-2 type transport system permease protein n=1 Tax=Krasilnikoviella flava TaxID=526729 RepID=A0A1T5LQZ6_9MICO|nr:ABC transporter permease subunit [Krasilnikoviella flava]SKC78341.1 ABC-2 type transport system permease protein [Krasilnikoviella flava]
MSATTTAGPVGHRDDTTPDDARVTFGHALRSEWLKLWSLRSQWWGVALTVLLMAGLAVLMASALGAAAESPGMQQTMDADPRLAVPSGVVAVTFGYGFAQLTVAVLAVLTITGEYSSGTIRATFAAVPRRLQVLSAKLLVVAATTAMLAVVGLGAAWLATASMLSADGLALDPGDGEQLRALGGTVAYLVAVAALSFGIGALWRSTAAAIATAVGVLLVLPLLLQVLAGSAAWAQDVYAYLPTVAGERVIATGPTPDGLLAPGAGFALLAGYAVAVLAAAAVTARRRDA